ncbi:hypothetical protein CONLIGDRAFT_302432 [Coniochaeta ligniaria NRRL 30616]|uniref:Nucleoporin NUP53 n=1 Tax=Coniochaeta ligniaria NRRL 30616 TaxID=1408157 RepID=A0A1J7IUH6_9PEZI|nr:hypothetical protein CONLIGDRAFT_302432 [Coniochaeta ligniaria NRRL 30616]
MAPLILHNVPNDELYVGDDGIQRPYAMVFPHQDDHTSSKRSRRAAAESGSFGKSSRRSRSKTATPARREDPTIAAADKVFSSWIQNQVQTSSTSPDDTTTRKLSGSQPSDDNPASVAATRFAPAQNEPTEVILRGYRSALQQYAAIDRFEQVAGRICEDYPRDPPIEQRRYKSELRDPAYTRRRALTPEERAKVNKADGGEHWVKVTFESAEAAELAISASPLSILGHLVYAEPYHGIPPTRDEAIPDSPFGDLVDDRLRSPSHTGPRRQSHAKNSSFSGRRGLRAMDLDTSPTSSRTADSATITSASETATLSSATSSATITGGGAFATTTGSDAALEKQQQAQSEFCRTIPTARKVRLLPAEQALLPQQSWTSRVLNMIPFLRWFSGSMIGNEVPRTETGEFDWDRASLYWKLICWLDLYFALFGGEILNADKDD